ncbi:MAG: hypothetical protein WDN69_20655 [Aliidongia sp.]
MRDLKACRHDLTSARKTALRAGFNPILKRRTGFAIVDRLRACLHANKTKLRMVFGRRQ